MLQRYGGGAVEAVVAVGIGVGERIVTDVGSRRHRRRITGEIIGCRGFDNGVISHGLLREHHSLVFVVEIDGIDARPHRRPQHTVDLSRDESGGSGKHI